MSDAITDDDVDALLCSAMKTLDDQVPSGYFDHLATQTLGRLKDSMQQTTTGTERDPSMASGGSGGIPAVPREEDSGLHDIRSLATSQRMRISKRSSQHPILRDDDDILASSSAGWKAVALPEPARMVSLPELSELPSKAEIKARQRTEKKAEAARPIVADQPPVDRAAIVERAPAPVTPIRTAAANQNRNKVLAIAGLGLAAAAGVSVFVATRGSSSPSSNASSLSDEAARPAPPAVARGAQGNAEAKNNQLAGKDAVGVVAAGSAMIASDTANEVTAAPGAPTTKAEVIKAVPKVTDGKKPTKEAPKVDKGKIDKPEGKSPTKGESKTELKTKGDGSEPSFDDLLKEAGVQNKKDDKPKLDKKALSGNDFKAGMSAVSRKAQSCYAGTQGTATVKLTIAPNGSISRVSVSGVFAGTPVAACVENAVRSASFPAWDGGPQSFGYSYLLSE